MSKCPPYCPDRECTLDLDFVLGCAAYLEQCETHQNHTAYPLAQWALEGTIAENEDALTQCISTRQSGDGAHVVAKSDTPWGRAVAFILNVELDRRWDALPDTVAQAAALAAIEVGARCPECGAGSECAGLTERDGRTECTGCWALVKWEAPEGDNFCHICPGCSSSRVARTAPYTYTCETCGLCADESAFKTAAACPKCGMVDPAERATWHCPCGARCYAKGKTVSCPLPGSASNPHPPGATRIDSKRLCDPDLPEAAPTAPEPAQRNLAMICECGAAHTREPHARWCPLHP